ncbi:uncharacterized protein LOC130798756, partial [Amaranthus tricolor]|uniref:uncharacterized protein LOC130798756 n=1 Tax=Amaranthus tricolor TaxID=29722 RepID=UPI00258827F1
HDHNIYSLHGSAILEDLIINLADAISSVYLEVISVDSETSEKISNYSLSLCTLSARALQKLRNEKLILQCFHNLCFDCEWVFTDIMAISFEEKLKQLLSDAMLVLVDVVVMGSKFGFRKYYFSLIIELSDIAVPMVKAIVSQVRTAISFFLVSLIGRSVGLVYTGIRQSLRWK